MGLVSFSTKFRAVTAERSIEDLEEGFGKDPLKRGWETAVLVWNNLGVVCELSCRMGFYLKGILGFLGRVWHLLM